MTTSIYVALPLMALLTIIQTAVLPFFPLFGLTPQLPFLVALSWALLHGLNEGLIWAFIAGFFLDLMSLTPLGISSLSFMLGIVAVIWIQQAIPTSRFLLPVLLGFLATAVYLLVYLFLMFALQVITNFAALPTLFPLTLLHAVLILPVYWLAYGIDRIVRPRRVQL